jgi:hypothetical protein
MKRFLDFKGFCFVGRDGGDDDSLLTTRSLNALTTDQSPFKFRNLFILWLGGFQWLG